MHCMIWFLVMDFPPTIISKTWSVAFSLHLGMCIPGRRYFTRAGQNNPMGLTFLCCVFQVEDTSCAPVRIMQWV